MRAAAREGALQKRLGSPESVALAIARQPQLLDGIADAG